MGVSGGPDLIQDGLVLALDASDRNSYVSGSSTWFDLIGTTNATLLNGPTFGTGSGGTIDFDGTNDCADLTYNSYWNSNVFGTATNFTIACWAKPNLFMNWDTIVSKTDFNTIGGWYSAGEGASIWSDASGFQGVFTSGVASNPVGSYVIINYAMTNTQKWYHLSFTGDGTNLRFYVDGILRGSDLVSSRTYPVTTSLAGPSLAKRASWNGQLGSVALYTRGLSADEVLQNYNNQKSRFGL